MLAYPVHVVPCTRQGVIVFFPDLPEAVVQGRSEEDAMAEARVLLETVLSGYVHQGREFPRPSLIEGAPTVATDRFSMLGMDLAA